MKTKLVWGNCFFGALYLLVRGKVSKLVAVTSGSIFWPHHYVCINKKGHVLHFEHEHEHSRNRFAPWWFEGRFVGIRKAKLKKALEDSGREVKFATNRMYLVVFIFVLIWLCLMLPWLGCWFFYTLCWAFFWGVEAIKKRVSNRVLTLQHFFTGGP